LTSLFDKWDCIECLLDSTCTSLQEKTSTIICLRKNSYGAAILFGNFIQISFTEKEITDAAGTFPPNWTLIFLALTQNKHWFNQTATNAAKLTTLN
jgi:hypothetical protein